MMWELSHFIRFCTNTDYNDSLRTTFTWKDVTCPHCLVKGKPEVDTGFKFAWRPSKSSQKIGNGIYTQQSIPCMGDLVFTCFIYHRRHRNRYYYLLVFKEGSKRREPMMWETGCIVRSCTNTSTNYDSSLRTTSTWEKVTCPHCLSKGKVESEGTKPGWYPSKSLQTTVKVLVRYRSHQKGPLGCLINLVLN